MTSIGFAISPSASSAATARVRGGARPASVVEPGQEREEEEERAEHVLALRDPGHRLDVERVNGEERRDDGGCASARRSRSRRKAKSRAALAACSSTLTRWCSPRVEAEELRRRAMCESQVSGCQFAARNSVKARAAAPRLSPPRTSGFSYTYCWSSRFTNPKPLTWP